MRLRLILSFTLIVLVSVTSMVLIAGLGAASEVRTFMFRGGMTGTEGLVGALEDHYRTYHTWQGVEDLLRFPGQGRGHFGPAMSGMMNMRLRLADAHGKLVIDTANPAVSGSLTPTDLEGAIPLTVDHQVIGYFLPGGGVNFSQREETLLVRRLSRAALTAGMIAGGLSLLLALLLAYRLLRPIRELTVAAGTLAKGDLTQRVPVRGDDELAVLGNTFNRMADSLQRIEESRRSMTADIAHELRNPLAVQRANLEALLDGVYPLNTENLAPILEQNHLLTRLVEDLRTLALADAGQIQLELTPTDFPALVKRVIERFAHQAESNQIEIHFSSEASCPPVRLDPGRVEQILGNLLSNALRYTSPGGNIALRFTRTQEAIQLSLHDSGPGIPENAIPHIFERFYRVDQSRSRSKGGSGLGLAIARKLAQAHDGSLSAANHPQGGAIFTLEFPIELENVNPQA